MKDLQRQTNINTQEKVNMIWNIADIIRGKFKPHNTIMNEIGKETYKRFRD